MSVAVAVGNSIVSFGVRWVVFLKASEGQRNNGQEKASESQIIRGIKSSLSLNDRLLEDLNTFSRIVDFLSYPLFSSLLRLVLVRHSSDANLAVESATERELQTHNPAGVRR